MEPHSRHHVGSSRLPRPLLLLLSTVVGQGESSNPSGSPPLTDSSPFLSLAYINSLFSRSFHRLLATGRSFGSTPVGMLSLTFCAFIPAIWYTASAWKKKKPLTPSGSINDASDSNAVDAVATDPGLLKKHSSIRAYTVPSTGFVYPAIRTFYRPHPQGDKLPSDPSPVPLLVFVHGLGGSVAQFHPILVSLVNLAPCLSIDFPGCGVSDFAPKDWQAYTTASLVHLLAVVIEAHRNRNEGQGIVFVGHSMGCSLAALLSSPTSPFASLLSEHVLGLIAICPTAAPPSKEKAKSFRKLLAIPEFIFDLWRKWDQRGGIESSSVAKFVGPNAEPETKKLQARFNAQSKTPVFRRMALGALPDYARETRQGGLPGKDTWAGLDIPVFLAAGEADKICPPAELWKIQEFLGKRTPKCAVTSDTLPEAAAPVDTAMLEHPHPDGLGKGNEECGVSTLHLPERPDAAATSTSSFPSSAEEATTSADLDPASTVVSPTSTAHGPESPPRRLVLKTTILPPPASHALLYAPATSRTLAGLIGTFLSNHVDTRLSLGWQLQYLSTEGKWDVKNLEKWKAVQPVSAPIAGVFRAMKTLREVDEQHCPKVFVKEWKGKVKAVVDISHESPVYDPAGLENGGIAYHKFPTVSKLPPTADEVSAFIELIDKVRMEPQKAAPETAAATAQSTTESTPLSIPPAQLATVKKTEPTKTSGNNHRIPENPSNSPPIGVHCHYGFNRTGFFLVSYMVERLGYKLDDAIDLFKKERAPGIRHAHFIDALYVRYCVGLKRAPTL